MTEHRCENDYRNEDLPSLIGKTMRSVTQRGRECIDFESDAGERWQMRYEPDCCASCEIEDVVGDLSDLIGAPILMAEASTNSDDPRREDDDWGPISFTWTFYRFATIKGYVTVRWYGTSNGYYSEVASFVSLDRRLDA